MDDRTGELLYALGNVAAKQERWYESFDYFSRALSQFQRTVGIEYASAAKMGVKLAYHCMRVGDYDSAGNVLCSLSPLLLLKPPKLCMSLVP